MNHLLPASLVNQRNADESCTSSGNASAFPGDLTPSIQEVEYMITTVLNMYVPHRCHYRWPLRLRLRLCLRLRV